MHLQWPRTVNRTPTNRNGLVASSRLVGDIKELSRRCHKSRETFPVRLGRPWTVIAGQGLSLSRQATH
jgi:hypothetical protein